MAKYRVMMLEKIFYEVYVEADNEEEAEEKANKAYSEDGVDLTDNYCEVIEIEEES